MQRLIERKLTNWLVQKKQRKPLILRGARQTGKTTSVRQFAKSAGLKLVEVNLELHNLSSLSKVTEPEQILLEIQAVLKEKIDFNELTLLFLDEIQEAPSGLANLRYFYEKMPHLPVIVSGSLLDFFLEEGEFSMPVGRVEFIHLGPMNFEEFLIALNEDILFEILREKKVEIISETIFEQFLQRYKEYLFVGGMPEAVKAFITEMDMLSVSEIHRSIIETYERDFPKYNKRFDIKSLDSIFNKIPQIVGEKVKFTKIDRTMSSKKIKSGIDLLVKAKVLMPVYYSTCSEIPLKAFADFTLYKLFFLDVGLLNFMLGLTWNSFLAKDSLESIKGKIAEQFVSQQLAYDMTSGRQNHIFYWLKDKARNKAEVDFVIQDEDRIIPIEVKAGKVGSSKSLLEYIDRKKCKHAILLNLNFPFEKEKVVTMKSVKGNNVNFKLDHFPTFLI